MKPSEELQMWTVYGRTRDVPAAYCARRWVIRDGKPVPTALMMAGDTLEEVRACLPAGLTRIPRAESDDPVILETWI